MADNDTLLAYLSPWFEKTENIAVEALGYILKKSSASREALDDVVRTGVRNVNPVAEVRTQAVGRDGTRPDLVGVDEEEFERVLIEAKFWAPLTDRQPVDYLDRLPAEGPSVLLFVAPDERIAILWPELRRRAEDAGKHFVDIDSERKCLNLAGTQQHLMLVSWTSLLDRISARASDAAEPDIEADIRQLRGLAESAEKAGFSPIRESGEDFGPDSRRMRDLRLLVDSATDRGVAAGWASRKGLNRTPKSYGYGRYLRLAGTIVWFGVNLDWWEHHGQTPLWVDCWKLSNTIDEIGDRLEVAAIESRWVPVVLKTNVGQSELLDDVVSKLKTIAEVIENRR